MTWQQLEQEVREWLSRLAAGDDIEFVAAADPGRVVVHVTGEHTTGQPELTLYVQHAVPTEPVPERVTMALDQEGWTKRSVMLSPPYDEDGIAGKIVHVLDDVWGGSPARWSYVGAEHAYGEALVQRDAALRQRGEE